MYLSNSKFVETILAEDASIAGSFAEGLEVILSLYKRYGSKLKLQDFQATISETSKPTAHLLQLLIAQDKLHVKDIQDMLLQLSKHAGGHTAQFTVSGASAKEVTKRIQDQFPGADVSEISGTGEGVAISGEGRYYKRSLDKDLDKLLK